MVKETKQGLNQCEECSFKYKTKSLAKECEAYCKKHKSCNTKIIKYAAKGK